MRTLLRRSPAYAVVRAVRRRQQRDAFAELLDVCTSIPAEDSAETANRLARTRAARRSAGRTRPRIVAFGTSEWEHHGLWQSFEALADFSLWQYRAPHETVLRPDDAYRRRLGKSFLQHVEQLEKAGPLHCAFFYASAEHIDLDVIRALQERGIWTLVMSLDDKHQFISPVDARGVSLQRTLAARCDVYWTTWKLAADLVNAAGGYGWYAPEGAHPAFHRPIDVPRDLDIVFVGQAYGPRSELVRFLQQRGLSVATFGSGWPAGFITFEQTVELYSRARVVLGFGGVGHMSDVKHLKGRDFEVPMCGALYLTTFNPELAEHFTVGSDILCYSSLEEAAELAHAMLRQPEVADGIRARALQRSLAEHTWEQRIARLLALTVGAREM